MEIIFQQKKLKFDNKLLPENIIQIINELLSKDYIFSYFIADGIEVLESHEDYLNQYINEIGRIEVFAQTVIEFVNDILLSAEDYIIRANPELGTLAEEFYDNPNSDSWSRFSQLLDGLQWLSDMILLIGDSTVKPLNWGGYVKVSNEMQGILKNLEEALQNEDNVLIGDLIEYEIIENFKALGKEIQKSIDVEGRRYDLS
ncbi:hypothetical protein M9R32_07055 [Paenisporosarcina quisquiliarum]|uniref:Uncharacterized protein n=1 Tax=Paenisporosarcina quisquiliarum TaxID=365346 RepID=A0A9X3LFG6_9BACL|nr:hypothetical protein [Paenisporosarcina quisquiliarum]MCZ8536938.1 hypothetical protein [Paenisporosarcina quisquiliarum]